VTSVPVLAQDETEEKERQETEDSNSTIVVTATRTEKLLLETPAAITVQNIDELRKLGFTYGTDEFCGVPGVFFRRGDGDGGEFPRDRLLFDPDRGGAFIGSGIIDRMRGSFVLFTVSDQF